LTNCVKVQLLPNSVCFYVSISPPPRSPAEFHIGGPVCIDGNDGKDKKTQLFIPPNTVIVESPQTKKDKKLIYTHLRS
jgi:hypothetical protein